MKRLCNILHMLQSMLVEVAEICSFPRSSTYDQKALSVEK